MGVERRAPPNPLRVSSETADGRGSILTDNNCSGADPRATLQQNFVFLFFISFAFLFFKPHPPSPCRVVLLITTAQMPRDAASSGDPDLPGSEPRDPATRRAHGGDKPDAAEPRLLGAHPLDANQSTRGTPKEVRELPGPNSRRELGVFAGVALPIPGRPTYSGRGSRRGRRWRGRGLEEAKPFSSALPRQRRRAA